MEGEVMLGIQNLLGLLSAGLWGVMLGAIFFGGLWWTVQRLMTSRVPQLWALGSYVVRSVVVVLGFWVVANRDWQRLLVCAVAFLATRIVVIRIDGRIPDRTGSQVLQ